MTRKPTSSRAMSPTTPKAASALTISDSRPLCSLVFRTQGRSYEENLDTLLSLIDQTPEDAIVLAPEVCLTGFDYENFAAAADFSLRADTRLRRYAERRTIVLTMIVRRAEGYFNVARVYHNGKIVHEQAKAKLFALGEEDRWFEAGGSEAVAVFEIDGIRMGILICFELRFTALWEQLKGAEIIFVPAQWGRLRASHFDILGKGLAVANECYVVQSDTDNDDTTGIGGVITPFGDGARNREAILLQEYIPQEVKKMRRYLNVGIE
ncbi:MAG TPA: carbon-nitrogen hydrolase family protein [Sulfuricurvum sp.]|nr:carbon-nitrogen hydrolase family protein [Sulfuricurvum sp.]